MGRISISLAAGLVLLVSGCSNLTQEEVGTASGAAMGVLVGSLFGDGAGKVVAMTVGGVVGGLVGKSVGRDLDESDRRKAQTAAFRAANAETAERVVWASDEKAGVSGYAEPAGKVEAADGNLCKDVRSVYVLDGKERSETSRFCFRNGRWEDG
jgi:surface antigen